MRVICSQKLLTHVLETMSHLLKQEIFPIYHSILLSAQCTESESLTLIGSGMYGMVGMLCHIPSTIEEDGQVLVPIEPLAEYIGTLRSGFLTLSQERKELIPSIQPLDIARRPEQAPPLTIESRYASQMGTISMNTARLKSWVAGAYPVPPIAQWLEEGVPIATFSASALRAAIAVCVPIARGHTRQKQGALEMSGILLRVDEREVVLIATTGNILVSHRISLGHPSPLSFSLLFDGKALEWIKKVLPEDGEITLTLAGDGKQNVLLLAMNDWVVFCRSMERTPTTWDHILLSPHETEFVVSRRDFSRALASFAALPLEEHQALALSIEEATLSMRIFPDADITMRQSHVLQLASASGGVTIFADPKQLKQVVSATTASMLCLQIG